MQQTSQFDNVFDAVQLFSTQKPADLVHRQSELTCSKLPIVHYSSCTDKNGPQM
jgi:hypothetical protein